MSTETTYWAGTISGTNRGWIKARICKNGEAVTARIVLGDVFFGFLLITAKGTQTGNKQTLDLLRYVPDRTNPIHAASGRAEITLPPDHQKMEGVWATDIGTRGNLILYRVSGAEKFPVALPSWFIAAGLHILRLLRKWVKWLYLIFLVVLSLASVLGVLKEKLPPTEAIILVLPVIFLLRYEIRQFFEITGIKKLGGLEIQDRQGPPPPSPPSLLSPPAPAASIAVAPPVLDPVTAYLLRLSQTLVPRTKALLHILNGIGRPVSRSEFDQAATILGVPADNVQTTLDALVSSGCLTLTDGQAFQVSNFGRQFLMFETQTRAS